MYNLPHRHEGTNPVAKVKLTAWRYLVVENNVVTAAAEAVQKTPGAKPLFSNTNEGPFWTQWPAIEEPNDYREARPVSSSSRHCAFQRCT